MFTCAGSRITSWTWTGCPNAFCPKSSFPRSSTRTSAASRGRSIDLSLPGRAIRSAATITTSAGVWAVRSPTLPPWTPRTSITSAGPLFTTGRRPRPGAACASAKDVRVKGSRGSRRSHSIAIDKNDGTRDIWMCQYYVSIYRTLVRETRNTTCGHSIPVEGQQIADGRRTRTCTEGYRENDLSRR